MTDNEIIKAFEICCTQSTCEGCPYAGDVGCLRKREMDVLKLIKKQQETITKLLESIKAMEGGLSK